MVATTLSFNNSIYLAADNPQYSGVVQIMADNVRGSGTLLYDGRAVLTAAHLFEGASSNASVVFDDPQTGKQTINASRVTILPDYEAVSSNNDLAIVWLDQAAPDGVLRHDLYRNSDELGQTFSLIGYGVAGTGFGGLAPDAFQDGEKRIAKNTFDTEVGHLDLFTFGQITWDPLSESQLVADFDDGSITGDSLRQLIGLANTGEGFEEGLITPGDSGGPAFIEGKVAGVASYIARFFQNNDALDNNNQIDSSFGELAFWQRMSFYQEWVDQQIRQETHADLPESPEKLSPVLFEGDPGDIQRAVFLLEFTGTVEAEAPVSVAYSTRDGSATAGEDYIPLSGRAVIYAGQQYTHITVELIEDKVAEPDEYFWLDIFEPVGGQLQNGEALFSAIRTITDDDVLIA